MPFLLFFIYHSLICLSCLVDKIAVNIPLYGKDFSKMGSFLRQRSLWVGLVLVIVITLIAEQVTYLPFIHQLGLSTLTIAIILGIIIGNTLFPRIATYTAVGVDFSKNKLLRLGIILYGFRITFQQIFSIGWLGLIIDALMILLTFTLALFLGRKLFKLDQESVILIGAGSSICGAAAVMATEPIVIAPAYKVSIAVATVVIFGTLSLFLYPLFYPYLDMSEMQYGVYVGSTIHEVAQVVVAGNNVSSIAGSNAVIVKMLRVMLLVPFLLMLSLFLKRESVAQGGQKKRISIPWFAILFIVASVINSLDIIPAGVLSFIDALCTYSLAMAMTALGLRTHVSAIKEAGIKPLLLALCLFLFLVVGGAFINRWVIALFGYV